MFCGAVAVFHTLDHRTPLSSIAGRGGKTNMLLRDWDHRMLSGSFSLFFFFSSKIRRSNFLFLNAVHAAHMRFELTEEEAAFRISN